MDWQQYTLGRNWEVSQLLPRLYLSISSAWLGRLPDACVLVSPPLLMTSIPASLAMEINYMWLWSENWPSSRPSTEDLPCDTQDTSLASHQVTSTPHLVRRRLAKQPSCSNTWVQAETEGDSSIHPINSPYLGRGGREAEFLGSYVKAWSAALAASSALSAGDQGVP